jgi:hypothetical protein
MTVSGLTFDTGMLIALERRGQCAWNVYRHAIKTKVTITVPTAVLVEWWRGRTDARERIRSGLHLEWLSPALAEVAGEALAAVHDATTVDAIVMASAASRGDLVYTSDVADLERFRGYFPTVRVLAV